jgi:hypothetical protein
MTKYITKLIAPRIIYPINSAINIAAIRFIPIIEKIVLTLNTAKNNMSYLLFPTRS